MKTLPHSDLLEIRGGSLTPTALLFIPNLPADPFLALLVASWPDRTPTIGDLHESAGN
ncbi:MAG TPA: hypothetical protein VEB66_16265 [Opitutaceae bacterium]|nr:hypothetical protein [Opitutaceae bacterium]